MNAKGNSMESQMVPQFLKQIKLFKIRSHKQYTVQNGVKLQKKNFIEREFIANNLLLLKN